MAQFPNYIQSESKDCGPTCIRIVAKFFGRNLGIQKLRDNSETTREGSSLLGLSEAAEKIGFRTLGVKLSYEQIKEAPLPCILHWNQDHFVVLYKISQHKRLFFKEGKHVVEQIHISDPAYGLLNYSKEEFLKSWIGSNATENTQEGIALLIEPSPHFYKNEFGEEETAFGMSFMLKYILKYKRFIFQLIIGLIAGSLLQLIAPFLTQSIVDVGIRNQDIQFIYLILMAQLFLFAGRMALEVIRSWILLHLSARINISLVSDFFIKLMNLPISFFDVRLTGDLLQRINDHKRIETLLTTTSLTVLFSLFNLVVFGAVLIYYNFQIFAVFALGSIFYFVWVLFFFKKRKDLDYKRFNQTSQEQSIVIELINGMQEIKLHNAERQMRWSWEHTQARLFNISIKSLSLEQVQNVGSSFINELKNILITVLAAKLVVDGQITLGMMMAITYIVGQLNAPIIQLINFMRDAQDAKISLDRLSEIHNKEDEDQIDHQKVDRIQENDGFCLENISFKYIGAADHTLENLDLIVPANKVTAIVGSSGGGKTTLMKLLLKFYETNQGNILIGKNNLNNISQKAWRESCGVVMQDGYIFNDTIARNIAVGRDLIDKEMLERAVDIANIKDFIEGLPLSYNTRVGSEGVGISAGQKQRILIARAVYKNPKFLFFDEATSALDANNEKVIMEKLDEFFDQRTVLVIAHRLSTVRKAHQIVVMEKGKIIEVGDHQTLVEKKGNYYHLVKNQLELGTAS